MNSNEVPKYILDKKLEDFEREFVYTKYGELDVYAKPFPMAIKPEDILAQPEDSVEFVIIDFSKPADEKK